MEGRTVWTSLIHRDILNWSHLDGTQHTLPVNITCCLALCTVSLLSLREEILCLRPSKVDSPKANGNDFKAWESTG